MHEQLEQLRPTCRYNAEPGTACHYDNDADQDKKLATRSYVLLVITRCQRITAKIPATLLGAHRLQPSSPTNNWAASWTSEALQHRS